MNGDGIDEIIVAPGQGRVGEVRVFTQAGVELTQFRTIPYGTSYKGGVEVAVGDVNGDGKNDIVTTTPTAAPMYGCSTTTQFSTLLRPDSEYAEQAILRFRQFVPGRRGRIVADVAFLNGTSSAHAGRQGQKSSSATVPACGRRFTSTM